MTETWTEREIAAFIDGELDEDGQARIAAVIEGDPVAARLAQRMRETDRLLRDAFAAPLDEPVPAGIAAALDSRGDVVTFKPRGRRPIGWLPATLAASLALAAGLAGGMMLDLARPVGPADLSLTIGPAATTLSVVLERVPSGETENGIRPLASFRVDAGVCREFESLSPDAVPIAFGIACRDRDAWSVIFAAATGDPGPGGRADSRFAPASATVVDTVGPLLDALGAGPALAPQEEHDAIAAGWEE